MKLCLALRQFDTVRTQPEQVYNGCAEECKSRRVDEICECIGCPVQQDDDLDFLAGDTSQARFQTCQRKEIEPARTCEILMQQVVPMKARPRERQQPLVCPE